MTANKGTDDHAGDGPREDENGQSADATAAQKSPATEAGQQVIEDKKPATPAVDKTSKASAAEDKQQSKAGQQASGTSAGKADDSKPTKQQPKSAADHAKSAQQSAGSGKKSSETSAAPTGKSASAGETKDTRPPGGHSGGGDNKDGNSKLPVIVAIVALVVAIIALVVAVWMWQQSKQSSHNLASRIENVQGNLQASVSDMVTEPLAQMRSRVDAATATVNAATKAGKQRAQAVADMRSQLRQTRLQLAGVVQQLQGDARLWWQLEQIENLLTVANRRLQLYGEPEQASSALQLASRMIARINDPRLFKVRKSIVDNVAALDALPSPDIEGMALKLSAFIGQVRNLPLASDVQENYQPERSADNNAATDESGVDWADGWHRFVNSVGNAVQSMATIRRADGTQPALLPPDQVYFLTQNLMLELRAARLALLEGNTTLYRNSLASATKWLKQYFDTSDTAVKAMLEGLKQLQNVKLEWQAPDISSSLRALRGYMQKVSQPDSAETTRNASEQNGDGTQSATDQQGSQ